MNNVRRCIASLSVLILLATLSAAGAAPCDPPARAVVELKAYFSYQNTIGPNATLLAHFSVVKLRNRAFFRHNNPPSNFWPGLRPVYVYDPARGMEVLTCPADTTWVNCTAEWDPEAKGRRRNTAQIPKGTTCEFDLEIPEWKPSPNNQRKERLALDLLRELRDSYEDFTAVYARDFNVDDPNIDFYIIPTTGDAGFLGCRFDQQQTPHCRSWHGYGMAPVDGLKQNVMEKPYRLYPSPVGKP